MHATKEMLVSVYVQPCVPKQLNKIINSKSMCFAKHNLIINSESVLSQKTQWIQPHVPQKAALNTSPNVLISKRCLGQMGVAVIIT